MLGLEVPVMWGHKMDGLWQKKGMQDVFSVLLLPAKFGTTSPESGDMVAQFLGFLSHH